ncbi:MAG: GNAT family N-acetyltransferase [Bacteroidales bacterium]|nr:GNAT family N-acetyltransferase [Bacteroidales bacterium]
MKTSIIPARPEDAPLIARAILMAIGDELTLHLAGPEHTPLDVQRLFESLARRTDSQYSYLNTLAALTETGEVAGLLICYDGADLHRLRIPFFAEAEGAIGLKINGDPDDETGPEEIYLDTLAVFPPHRGKGIGRRLIAAAAERAHALGRPLGLLVSKHNPEARRLYDSIGFREAGERPFAGEMMTHLQLPPR